MSIIGSIGKSILGAIVGKYLVTALMTAVLGIGGFWAFSKIGPSDIEILQDKFNLQQTELEEQEAKLDVRNKTIAAFSEANKDNEDTIDFLTKKNQKLKRQYEAEAQKSEERRLLAIAESNRRIKAEKFNAEIIKNNPEISLWLNSLIPANGLQ